jgi:hypothetical protein
VKQTVGQYLEDHHRMLSYIYTENAKEYGIGHAVGVISILVSVACGANKTDVQTWIRESDIVAKA